MEYFPFTDQTGFVSPDRWTTADFLTSVGDKHERNVKAGWEARIPRSASQFAETYKNSDVYQKNLAEVREFEQTLEQQRRERLAAQNKNTQRKNYTLPFHAQVWACTQRQFLITAGDRAALIGKWGGILFQALIVGSMFYNIPDTTAGVFTRYRPFMP